MPKDQIIANYVMKISNFNMLMKILSQLPGPIVHIENSILLHRYRELHYRCDLTKIKPLYNKLSLHCRIEKKIRNRLSSIKTYNNVVIYEYNKKYQIEIDNLIINCEKDLNLKQDLSLHNSKLEKITDKTNVSALHLFKLFVYKKSFIDLYIHENKIIKLLDEHQSVYKINNDENYHYILRVFDFLNINYLNLSLQVRKVSDKVLSQTKNIVYPALIAYFLFADYKLADKIILHQAEQAMFVFAQEKEDKF